MGDLSETRRIDKQDAAALIGVTERTFQKFGLQPDDMDGVGGRLWYLLDDVLAIRDQRKLEVAEKEWARSAPVLDDNGDLIDEAVEKKKKLKAERIGQEIKNAEALGGLAPLDLMSSALRDSLQQANAWLESVPARIKRVWPETPGTVLETIERECATLRNSIADARISYSDARMADYSEVSSLGDQGGP